MIKRNRNTSITPSNYFPMVVYVYSSTKSDPNDRSRVYIDNSLLVNRSGHSIGKGLFAKCFIPSGTTFCSYWGKVIKTTKAKSADYASDYVLQCSNDWSIDAKSKLSCYGRYCNDPFYQQCLTLN